jgi:tRNA-uridine 2-sulfurtransferase
MKKKIVVGIGKGLDGVVSAYLLKKQGFDVHIAGINLNQVNFNLLKKDTLGNEEVKKFNLPSNCSGADLNRLKKIGNLLGVSYSFVDRAEDFNELVVEKTACLSFAMFKKIPCFSCHKIMFLALESVRLKIGADFISSGHYAKVQRNHSTGVTAIVTGNDLKNDQSGLLSNVPNDIFQRLVLPLGDLQNREITKIAEKNNFFEFKSDQKFVEGCFNDKSFKNFTEDYFSNSLKKDGALIRRSDGFTLCQHKGLHQFNLGEVIPSEYSAVASGHIAVAASGSSGKVVVSPHDDHECSSILLKLNYLKKYRNFSFKLSGKAVLVGVEGYDSPSGDNFLDVEVFLKAGMHLKVDFITPLNCFPSPGAQVSIYEKVGEKNLILLAAGEICFDSGMSLKKVDAEGNETQDEKSFNYVNF